MKKLMMAAALVAASLSANAQVYVGGGLSVHSYDNQTTKSYIRFVPEVGYNINDKMSIGVQVGFATTSFDTDNALNSGKDSYTEWGINPYFRYKFVQAGNFTFFGDATVGYGQQKTKTKVLGNSTTATTNNWGIGVRPGVSYNISDHFSLVSTIGWLGYKSSKLDADGAKAAGDFGLDLSGESITFSLYYNF